MLIDSEALKSEISNLKKGNRTNWDYDTGYTSALTAVEGLIAILEENCAKCKHCKPLKELTDDGWVTKHCCILWLASEPATVQVVRENDLCECFEAK